MGKKGKKRGPRRNSHQKSVDQKTASELRKEGKSLRAIGENIGLSHEQVRLDLDELDKVLQRDAQKNIEQVRAQCETSLWLALSESLKGWQLSLMDAVTVTEKEAADTDGDAQGELTVVERTTVKKGQSGNSSHIKNIIKASEALAKLHGLYESAGSGDAASDLLTDIYEQILENRPSGPPGESS